MKIRVNDTGIYRGVAAIAEQLPDPRALKPGEDITIAFTGTEFVYLTGLVMLATWRKALPAGIHVHVDDSACQRGTQAFLTNTGFREIIDTGHEIPSVNRRIGKVPLQPITNQFSKEATVNDIVALFDEYSGHVEDLNPFKVMVSELCENVLAHSESSSPGYVCARVLENSGKAEITICDSGVGIYQSYMAGTNEDIKNRILKGASALDLALDGLNSSKPITPAGSLRSYYGFGLLVTRRLVEENRGQLLLLSGKEGLNVDRFERHRTNLTHPFQGTFIGIVLDLNNPLPLEEIYDKASEQYTGIGPMTASKKTKKALEPNQKPLNTGVGIDINSEGAPANKESTQPEPPTTDLTIRRIELRHYGTELLTRDAGTAIRADIAGYLAAGYVVEVSLDDVTDITPSVADEAFAKLAEILGHRNFEERVKIMGGTQIAQRLVAFVLNARQRKQGS